MSDLPIHRSLHDLLDQRTWLADLAQALVRDPHAAEDAAQQTWLQALVRKAPLREPRAWLSAVLGNVVRQRHRGEVRRLRREQAAAAQRPDELAAVADANERFEVQRAVAAAVQALDEPFRTTVLLHYFEDRSLADIARLQQVPTGTVRWRLHRAHQLLRGRLAGSYGEDWRSSLLVLCPGPRRAALLALPLLAGALLVGGLTLWPALGGDPATPLAAAPARGVVAPGEGRGASTGRDNAARAVVEHGGAQDPGAVALALGDARANVRARIVGADGTPLANATLRLHGLKLDRLDAPAEVLEQVAPPVRSDADGRVLLALRVPAEFAALVPELKTLFEEEAKLPPGGDVVGEAELAASAEGQAEQRVTVRLAPGDDRDLGTITLTAVATVHGRVLADDGTPCGDASVGVVYPPFPQFCDDRAARQLTPNMAEKTRSEPGGAFAIAGVRTGLALVWASKPGCIGAYCLVDVAPERTACADLVLRATSAVAPEPWVQELRVRVVDTAGAPVRGARVDHRWDGPAGMAQSGMTRTDNGGRATLQYHLFTPQRVDRVAIAASCDDPPLGPVLVHVTPRGDEETIELPKARRLRVRAHDEDGRALRAFTVVASANPPATGESSATAGDHVATVLAPAAAATLTIRSEGFAERTVPFLPDTTPDEIVVTLARTRGITGMVTAEGRPVADACVSLLHCRGLVLRNGYRSDGERRGLFDAKTGADGRFRVDVERPGPLRLLVRAPGFANAVTDRREFDPGAGWNNVRIELAAGGTLEGHVRGDDGAPLPRALVAINDFFGDARTVSADGDGRYRCEHLRAGAYEVCLATQAITDDSESTIGMGASAAATARRADCEVRDGETTTFDLVAGQCRVRGRLVGTGFDPRGWRATLTRNLRRATDAGAVLRRDGTFELATSGLGEHELALEAPGGPLGNVRVELAVDLQDGDNELTVALALAPLRGRAVGTSPTAWTGLRQEVDGRTITVPVRVDPLTLDFTVDFAPVGEVVLVQGTPSGSADVARFVVAPR